MHNFLSMQTLAAELDFLCQCSFRVDYYVYWLAHTRLSLRHCALLDRVRESCVHVVCVCDVI